MANQSTAYGLRPIWLVGSGANSTGVTQYEIASNNTNAIYQYSIVVPTSAGTIDQAGDTAGGTTPALGVLMGVEYHDSVQKKPVWINYWPGSGAVSVDTNYPVKAYVADDRAALLGEDGKVKHGSAFALEVGGHGNQGADRHHAGAADAGDQQVIDRRRQTGIGRGQRGQALAEIAVRRLGRGLPQFTAIDGNEAGTEALTQE